MTTRGPSQSPLDHVSEVVEQVEHAVVEAAHSLMHGMDLVLRLPEPRRSRWHRAGISRRTERIMDGVGALVLLLLTTGWTWSIAAARSVDNSAGEPEDAPSATAAIASAITDPNASSAAFLTDAVLTALTPLRGESGKLRARVQSQGTPLADSLPSGAQIAFSSGELADSASALGAAAPSQQGVWQMAVKVGSAIKPVADFSVITMTPFSAKRRGRIGLYFIGSWPTEGRSRDTRPKYAPPAGFIEVTQENQDTPLSEHFTLRDFLTHDQQNVWPKYLVIDTRLVDKLELVLEQLKSQGVDVSRVRVMSGFRTPQYNVGGGDPRGRATLSRHMYGDAADIFIDSDGNERMDDLNRDRRSDLRDARVIEAAVSRVEQEHPALLGGCGVYPATGEHGPFVHIDTRGYRARWLGGAGDS